MIGPLAWKKNISYWVLIFFFPPADEDIILANIIINEIVIDAANEAYKICDGILNSFQAPNFTYMVKNRADLINSDGQAHELLSNIIPSEVKVHIK